MEHYLFNIRGRTPDQSDSSVPQVPLGANRRLSSPQTLLANETKQHLSNLRTSFCELVDSDTSLMGEMVVDEGDMFDPTLTRLSRINNMLKGLLGRGINQRPTVKQIELHASANSLISRVENDIVNPQGLRRLIS